MELAELLATLERGEQPEAFLPPLKHKSGANAYGSFRRVVYDAGGYIVKALQNRTVWRQDIERDPERYKDINAEAFADHRAPMYQDHVPTLPAGVFPPEQYVAGGWLVQKKYTPIFDPLTGMRGAALSAEESDATRFGGSGSYLDLNTGNLGRDEDGRLVAFDW